MIVEERIYVLHTGVELKDYLTPYVEIGLPVQRSLLGGFLGYFVTEFGVLNQLTHLWAYQDLEDRRERRQRLASDEQWLSCLKIIRPMIMTMENKILSPVEFSPIRSLPVENSEFGTAFTSGRTQSPVAG
jgi:hypothetical protein